MDEAGTHAYIDAYVPRTVAFTTWSAVEAETKAVLLRVSNSLSAAKVMSSHVAAYAGWLREEGLGVGVQVLADLETIERYIQVGMKESAESTRATRRAVLRRVAGRLDPLPIPAPRPISYRRVRPAYPAWQTSRFLELARNQPTSGRRQSCLAILALGLGCGLDGRDMAWVCAPDVTASTGGTVQVVVAGGSRPRTVTALAGYAPLLTECAETAGTGLLIGGEESARHNVTSVALTRMISDPTLPVLVASRLRSTWLLAHLNLRTPLAVLLPAAGLATARPLEDLLADVEPIDAAEAARLLHGRL